MTRIVSLTLAGALAASSLAMIVAPAAADGPRYYQGWHQHPWGGPGERHGDHDGWGVGGALVGGTVFGLALGATLYDPPPPPPAYVYAPYPPPPPVYPHYVYADHIAWCTAHFPGYNGETDTFVGSNGVVYRCVGPY
jgi:hypothetical protein